MTSAPTAAAFPLDALRPSGRRAPHLAASFGGACLGWLGWHGLQRVAGLQGLENWTITPQILDAMGKFDRVFADLWSPLAGDAPGLLMLLAGAIVGRLLPVRAKGSGAARPQADEVLLGWVRAGDGITLQFASGSWLLVRAEVNDREWRHVQRLLVWCRRMARPAPSV